MLKAAHVRLWVFGVLGRGTLAAFSPGTSLFAQEKEGVGENRENIPQNVVLQCNSSNWGKIKKSYLDPSPRWNILLKCLRNTASPVSLRGFGERKEARTPPTSIYCRFFTTGGRQDHWENSALDSDTWTAYGWVWMKKKDRRLSCSSSPWLTRT